MMLAIFILVPIVVVLVLIVYSVLLQRAGRRHDELLHTASARLRI